MGNQFIFRDVTQGSDDWYNLRIGKVTASQFGVIMANESKGDFGDPARRYAVRLALEQITGARCEDGFSNAHMERGHEQEPVARMLYEEENFVDVKNGGFFDYGLYSSSPDGLVLNDGVIEIKSVIATTHYATLQRGTFDPAYKWQLIGHLDCTGRQWVDFVSYCAEFPEDKQLITHRLYRDDYADMIERLRERREMFLQLVRKIKDEITGG